MTQTQASQHQSQSKVRIQIWTLCGSFCVAASDGEKVFTLVERALSQGQTVVLSFEGVESLATAFLNSAVGQLLRVFDAQLLRERLEVEDISPEDLQMLRRVIENAKRYFADPTRFEAAQQELEAA